MKILKFGGTSIKTSERVLHVVELLKKAQNESEIAVVVSAFGGVTDQLVEMCRAASQGKESYLGILKKIEANHYEITKDLIDKKNIEAVNKVLHDRFRSLADTLHGIFLLRELSPRSLDIIMSFGERLSAFIISQSLCGKGIPSEFLDAAIVVKTDETFNDARVHFDKTNANIREYFANHKKLQVITGFIASDENGNVTTLGRSGSDYTAAIFGAALGATEIQIWTDVNGVMTCDPRKVKSAFSMDSMTYEEAMEMSHFGSKVIHPKAMQPALEKNIPLRIKNTFKPEFPGTVIGNEVKPSDYVIKGISSIHEIALLRVQGSGMLGVTGISARLFGALAKAEISVILISQGSSEHSICFAVAPGAAKAAKKAIDREFSIEILAHQVDKVTVEIGLSAVAVVGEKMRGTSGIAARVFQAVSRAGANVVAIAQGSSELNISVVISQKDEETTLNAIHDIFFGKEFVTVHIFMVGIGLVGKQLLEQISKQHALVKKKHSIDFRINAVSNSRKMLFNKNGLSLNDLPGQLDKSDEKASLFAFFEKMKTLNFRNSVFVDCTASDDITLFYEKILKLGISIVTPNKRAMSGSYEMYKQLKTLAVERRAGIYYETNVGASLPIIQTLDGMISSGDTMLKIETIISGTLSFLFNSFDGTRPFSKIVREAQERGFTEPDPREDLNGVDVARKLLILARESGMELELSDIEVENILPESCKKAKSVEDFYGELEKNDAYFEKKRKAADENGKVLRYIAILEKSKAKVSLQAIDAAHPFFHLKESENIIAIQTRRYDETPLVIKGSGAGADLTAAGVFADIIKTAHF